MAVKSEALLYTWIAFELIKIWGWVSKDYLARATWSLCGKHEKHRGVQGQVYKRPWKRCKLREQEGLIVRKMEGWKCLKVIREEPGNFVCLAFLFLWLKLFVFLLDFETIKWVSTFYSSFWLRVFWCFWCMKSFQKVLVPWFILPDSWPFIVKVTRFLFGLIKTVNISITLFEDVIYLSKARISNENQQPAFFFRTFSRFSCFKPV